MIGIKKKSCIVCYMQSLKIQKLHYYSPAAFCAQSAVMITQAKYGIMPPLIKCLFIIMGGLKAVILVENHFPNVWFPNACFYTLYREAHPAGTADHLVLWAPYLGYIYTLLKRVSGSRWKGEMSQSLCVSAGVHVHTLNDGTGLSASGGITNVKLFLREKLVWS